MALGVAASQPIGMREQFGSMTKPFHPGGAARAGLMSALMAHQGFTASPKAIEAPRGMMQDAMLETKFHGMCDAVVSASRCDELIEAAWNLGAAGDVKRLIEFAAGRRGCCLVC